NEMGRVPLLAREDELRVGTEIRIAWKRYSVLIFESALGIRETLRLLEDVQGGRLPLGELLQNIPGPDARPGSPRSSRRDISPFAHRLRALLTSGENLFRSVGARSSAASSWAR